MRSSPECIPCSVRQAIRTARIAGLDEEAQNEIARRAMEVLIGLDHAEPPAVLATRAIRSGDHLLSSIDPFERIKWETTVEALAMYEHIKPEIERRLSRLDDVGRVRLCVKLAAAGNIIDFGVGSEFDLEKTLRETISGELTVDESEELTRALKASTSVLLISDNAGEIVFDRFLLDESLRLGKEVYVSVKSRGILNDATYGDAVRAGIGEPIKIIETGSDSLGIILDECSDQFKDIFSSAGVVISKGQANYETLDDAERQIFFILKAKCPIVAQQLGVSPSSNLLCRGGLQFT